MSDRWEALRRPDDERYMLAPVVRDLLAERDALAERNAKLLVALQQIGDIHEATMTRGDLVYGMGQMRRIVDDALQSEGE